MPANSPHSIVAIVSLTGALTPATATGGGKVVTNVSSGVISLADLTYFDFQQQVNVFGTLEFTLANLSFFAASVSNGMVTSLSFGTNYTSTNNSNPIQLTVSNLGTDGTTDYTNATGRNGFLLLGSTTVTSVTSSTAFVPEPASWLMMLAGFGMVGAAMRRRLTPSREVLRDIGDQSKDD